MDLPKAQTSVITETDEPLSVTIDLRQAGFFTGHENPVKQIISSADRGYEGKS